VAQLCHSQSPPRLDDASLQTLRLTGEGSKNLSAVSGVAYKNSGAIFPSLPAPNVAPKILMMNPFRLALPFGIRLLDFTALAVHGS
jgi:hypothetical protein